MKVGEIVKIKTPLDFCDGVYNNAMARVKIYRYGYSSCVIDLIKEEDKIRAERFGYVTKNVQVSVSYCRRGKAMKLNI